MEAASLPGSTFIVSIAAARPPNKIRGIFLDSLQPYPWRSPLPWRAYIAKRQKSEQYNSQVEQTWPFANVKLIPWFGNGRGAWVNRDRKCLRLESRWRKSHSRAVWHEMERKNIRRFVWSISMSRLNNREKNPDDPSHRSQYHQLAPA